MNVRRDRGLLIGVAIVLAAAVVAMGAQWLAPYSPTQINIAARLAGPSSAHLLGTDELGRDLLSRLMYGARVSLGVASLSIALAALLGVLAGGFAGLRRGVAETLVLRFTDVVLGFPAILIAIVLVAILGLSLTNVVIAIAVAYAPQFLRLTWASVLVLREHSYVESARLSGRGTLFILFRHLVPNMLPELMVQATLALGNAILVEATLSYLGLGVQPPLPSWGGMINAGQQYISVAPSYTVFPGLAIALTVLGFNFLGDGLTRVLDPRRSHL